MFNFQSIINVSIFKEKAVGLFLAGVLLLVNIYSLSTLTTKPAYWYDEAINVELARNFADFGKLDLVIAPNTFSDKGATVGSTGYPVTVPLAGFFKLFGFGLAEARVYMLLWMNALLFLFFFFARELWGTFVAYGGVFLIATFAPFYGNGRSVMGEIPGFLFFLCAYYLFEHKKWLWAGLLLGLSVISKPSVFVFLIPAFALTVLILDETWKKKFTHLVILGVGALLALVPWFVIYATELSRGGLAQNIFSHFKNPYVEAGVSVFSNISTNLPTLITSTTLIYMWILIAGVLVAFYYERDLLVKYRNLITISAVYLPLALLQYLKSFGYLRYLVAGELLIFILFLIALPTLSRIFENTIRFFGTASCITATVLACMVVAQTVHLFAFSDLYASDKTQKTILYLYTHYPQGNIGVINVPQVASFIPASQKYQYLSTYGLWEFGVRILFLPEEKLPPVIVTESKEQGLSGTEQDLLRESYDEDTGFKSGFTVYRKK